MVQRIKRGTVIDMLAGIVAAVLIAGSLWQLEHGRAGLSFDETTIGRTPARVIARDDLTEPAPAVVITHGFAGARRLMEPFAVTLARAGYVTVSVDFLAHGAHPDPLPGRIEGPGGAADLMIRQIGDVVAHVRSMPMVAGGHAVLGHSMATDLMAKAAGEGLLGAPRATVAVSLFSPDVTAFSPPNMLVITGGWEMGLTGEAFRVVNLTANTLARPSAGIPADARLKEPPPGTSESRRDVAQGFGDGAPILDLIAAEGDTVGDFADGTARRIVFADGVEHIGVLFDPEGQAAAVDWLDRAFGRSSPPVEPDIRGPWIGLLFAGMALAIVPLSRLLPRLGDPTLGGGLRWPALLVVAIVPAVLAPVIVVQVPSGMLPIVLGDYLSKHFLVQGLLTWLALWLAARRGLATLPRRADLLAGAPRLGLAALALGLWVLAIFYVSLDRYAFPFWPTADRVTVVPVMALALLPWFLADEWLTRRRPDGRGSGARTLAYALTKVIFVASLALAVALDPGRLFFLLIVAPVILVFFLLYGVVSQVSMQRTGHPFVAGAGIAGALAWSIAVSFPLLAI